MTKTPKSTGVSVEMPVGYADTLTALKARVREAQFRAQRVVNPQLIEL